MPLTGSPGVIVFTPFEKGAGRTLLFHQKKHYPGGDKPPFALGRKPRDV
jgi:hypothetical protein